MVRGQWKVFCERSHPLFGVRDARVTAGRREWKRVSPEGDTEERTRQGFDAQRMPRFARKFSALGVSATVGCAARTNGRLRERRAAVQRRQLR